MQKQLSKEKNFFVNLFVTNFQLFNISLWCSKTFNFAMNSDLNLLYRCNHHKKRLYAFRDSAVVDFDGWFPDRLSGCSFALSLIRYWLVVRCFIVKVFSSTVYSVSKQTIFSLFCIHNDYVVWKKLVGCFKYCILCHI